MNKIQIYLTYFFLLLSVSLHFFLIMQRTRKKHHKTVLVENMLSVRWYELFFYYVYVDVYSIVGNNIR